MPSASAVVGAQMNLRDARNSAALTPPSPSSVTIVPAARGGRFAKLTTSVALAPRPACAGVDAEVGQAQRLDRLLLRRHDPLERRVPRLVDLLDHADHRGQRRLDGVVAVVGLPVDADLRAVGLHLAGERHLRHAEPLGQHRRQRAHPRVGGLRAEDHQVEPGALEHASPAPPRSPGRQSRAAPRR